MRKTRPAATRTAPQTMLAEVVVVTCGCGNFPLEKAMQPTPQAAWLVAADHVSLNPKLCKPSMNRDRVPAALAPPA